MATLKGDFAGVKGDVATLRTDTAGMKVEVGTAKGEMTELRAEVRDLGRGVAELDVHQRYARDGLRELGETVRGIDSDLDEVKGVLHEMKGAAASQTTAMQTQATAMQGLQVALSELSTSNGAAPAPGAVPAAVPAALPAAVPAAVPAANGDKAEAIEEAAVAKFLGKYLLVPFIKKAGPLIATAAAAVLATWMGLRMLGTPKAVPVPASVAAGGARPEMGPTQPADRRAGGRRAVPNGD